MVGRCEARIMPSLGADFHAQWQPLARVGPYVNSQSSNTRSRRKLQEWAEANELSHARWIRSIRSPYSSRVCSHNAKMRHGSLAPLIFVSSSQWPRTEAVP